MFDKEKYNVSDVNVKKVKNGFVLEVGYTIKEQKEDVCGYESETLIFLSFEEVFEEAKKLLS